MQAYKFRVVVDTDDDIFRDIVVAKEQTFADLHQAILAAFSFRGDQMASFYMSNESWEKGQEIGLMDMSFGGESGPATMKDAILKDFVTEPDQKVLYVYDFLKMWIFYIELTEEVETTDEVPTIVLSFGDAPNEDEKEMEDLFEGIDLGNNASNTSEFDDIFNEFNDDFSSEGFENIDDYDI